MNGDEEEGIKDYTDFKRKKKVGLKKIINRSSI